jgi:cellulase/cellobiase CelA1
VKADHESECVFLLRSQGGEHSCVFARTMIFLRFLRFYMSWRLEQALATAQEITVLPRGIASSDTGIMYQQASCIHKALIHRMWVGHAQGETMSQQLKSSRKQAIVRGLSGYFTVLAVLLLTLVVPGAFAQTHVSNPYAGAMVYVSPDYATEVATAETAEPSLAGQMATVAKQPTFVWLDRIAAIAGGTANSGRMSLQDHINAAVAQANGADIVVQLVIYDLPDRDCAAAASNGELSIAGGDIPKGYTTALTGTGIEEYENDYITPIYNILAAAPSNVRFVLVIEDDSLPNLLTNTGVSFTDAPCVAANDGVSNAGAAANWTQTATPALNIPSTGVYYQGISFAANTFHKLPNAYNYLDIGHHGWLGWTSNTAYAVQFFSSFAQQLSDGYATIDGFITNTANYGPLTEPYLTWDEVAGGGGTSTSNGIQRLMSSPTKPTSCRL